jgi:hypothetical protein
MGRILQVGLLALALAGCAGGEPGVNETVGGRDVNTYPDNYKAEVLAYLRNYLNDLSGVHNASISVPAVRTIGKVDRYASCVRFSARTPGASASGRDYLVLFLAGKLDQVAPTSDLCQDAVYQPFPELERLKR